ncbi:MAG TPA: hypothetical protein VLA98_09875 [Solirubrobacteraceae bacterium]|nr:hypothetical protein [Solirubrobacteraceae bacterium]
MRLRRLLPVPLVLGAVALPGVAHAYPLSFGPVAKNPADRLAALPADAERYDRSRRCTRGPRAGTVALQGWLERHWRGTSWGIMRCERLSRGTFSLHADGRALDWHLDRSVPADARAARRLIELLLAPDALGTPHALARRMGVQEIIWDCRAWWAGSSGMASYSVCLDRRGRRLRHVNVTLAHRDHVHLGLSFAGAAERTSFWTTGLGAR